METHEIILLSLLGVFVLLVAIILIRALLFNDKTVYQRKTDFTYEEDDVVKKLGAIIKIPTVSHPDPLDMDMSKFDLLIETVIGLYPTVFSKCKYEITPDKAIKIKVNGSSSSKPTVLMAHYDVVPVVEEAWEHDPFLGEVIDDKLYGRGTLDTKCTMICALSALEKALQKGYVPKNDL